MGDGVFGYPESKHGGKIKERPFADAKNLPYNPPHLIVHTRAIIGESAVDAYVNAHFRRLSKEDCRGIVA